ncbi:conserved Plasmodium protein, unknown function [Plasmodium reichenowi]|uniref:Uncharacterized protein n=1 Tax=Plasmodium reichenowi TaxID=5854 RepID=A0A2P9DA21_PLARE|nr:conserved Plasmodium protein, unknown function [Plasmodium reichenowi]
MNFPNRIRYDKRLHDFENLYRKKHIIHYYLKKNDVITCLAEIRQGASPFIRDECNRTALDLAIVLFMKKFHECIFTCLITDFIYCKSKKYDSLKTKITYNEYEKIVEKEKNICYSKYILYDDMFSKKKKKKESMEQNTEQKFGNVSPFLLLQRNVNPFLLNQSYKNDGNIYTKYCETNDILFLSEEVITFPISKTIQAQLDDILRKMNALLFFIKILCKNIILKKGSELTLQEEISNLTFPFFYNNTIHTLFKIYPFNSCSNKWDIHNPADARRLIHKILSKKLIGTEIITFIGKIVFCFSELIHIYGPKIFELNSLYSQYFLHMAFTLDNEYLFKVIINKQNIFTTQTDIFHWDELIQSIEPHKEKFKLYYKQLIYARLKKLFMKKLEKVFYKKEMDKNINNHSNNNSNIKCRTNTLHSTYTTLLKGYYEDILNCSNAEDLEIVIQKFLHILKKKKLTTL